MVLLFNNSPQLGVFLEMLKVTKKGGNKYYKSISISSSINKIFEKKCIPTLCKPLITG